MPLLSITGLVAFLRTAIFAFGYISNNALFPEPLSPEEEAMYLEKYMEGDEEARNILIERNLRLVAHICKKYNIPNVDNDDLISIGTIGLIKGINTFNTNKGVRLATYASRCIENEILMYLRKSSKIKGEVSIDEPLNQDGDGNELLLSDILGTEADITSRRIEDEVDKTLLKSAVKKLNKREKYIMELRFGFNGEKEKTQKEVADMLRNITKLHIKTRKKNNEQNEKRHNEQNRVKKWGNIPHFFYYTSMIIGNIIGSLFVFL